MNVLFASETKENALKELQDFITSIFLNCEQSDTIIHISETGRNFIRVEYGTKEDFIKELKYEDENFNN